MSGWDFPEHALPYLNRAGSLPHRVEGETMLLEMLPAHTDRVLDLATGDGRLLALVREKFPKSSGVALDFSPPMLERARERFVSDRRVEVFGHDLNHPLPDLGEFDAVISGFALHHLAHERKRILYSEVFSLLKSGGMFVNLDRVSSPTPGLRRRFLVGTGHDPDSEDPLDLPLDLDTQLRWLREIGFSDVDCNWKWLEFALFSGVNPESRQPGRLAGRIAAAT
ncbi:MAG: class I SAM-dependent methyltransferase [Rubrobacteraceae bacterium]